jgi:lauroyl/myristoyl acyltransferase
LFRGLVGSEMCIRDRNIATAFESGIARTPEDWHMLQRIWIEEGIYS